MPSAWGHSGFHWARRWAPRPAVLVGCERQNQDFLRGIYSNTSLFENSSIASPSFPPPNEDTHGDVNTVTVRQWAICPNCPFFRSSTKQPWRNILNRRRWWDSLTDLKTWKPSKWELEGFLANYPTFMLPCLIFCFLLRKGAEKSILQMHIITELVRLVRQLCKITRWNHQKFKAEGGRDDDICLVWNIGLDLKFPAGWCRMGLIKPECISWKTNQK